MRCYSDKSTKKVGRENLGKISAKHPWAWHAWSESVLRSHSDHSSNNRPVWDKSHTTSFVSQLIAPITSAELTWSRIDTSMKGAQSQSAYIKAIGQSLCDLFYQTSDKVELPLRLGISYGTTAIAAMARGQRYMPCALRAVQWHDGGKAESHLLMRMRQSSQGGIVSSWTHC